jgi:uncharacterized RDD family membrane protein YckC
MASATKGGSAANGRRPGADAPRGRALYDEVDARYPATGPGSVATFGARLYAYLVDAILSVLIAIAINGGYHVGGRQNLVTYLAFLAIEFGFLSALGQTPGMRAAGIAVVRTDGRGKQSPKWIAVRTLLLAVIAPALIIDATGRAMHDRAAGTVLLRTR